MDALPPPETGTTTEGDPPAHDIEHNSNREASADLQGIPTEVANQIYGYLCKPAYIPIQVGRGAKPIPGFLQVTRKIRHEAAPMWFPAMMFMYSNLESLIKFLGMLEPAYRAAISCIKNMFLAETSRHHPLYRHLELHHHFLRRLDLDIARSVLQIRDLGSAGFDRKWKNVDKLEPDSASIREMDKDVRYWEIDVVRAKTLGLEKKFLHLQGLCVPADDTGFFEVVKTVKQAHDEAEAKMIKATEKILKRSPPLRSHGRL